MKINDIQNTIIGEFSDLADWFDKYQYLIFLGKSHKIQDKNLQSEQNALKGCQSQVWISAMLHSEKVLFSADSDSLIVKGIISLLIRILSGQSPSEVVKADLYFLRETGLQKNLSPTRSNGIAAIVKQMKSLAEKLS